MHVQTEVTRLAHTNVAKKADWEKVLLLRSPKVCDCFWENSNSERICVILYEFVRTVFIFCGYRLVAVIFY